jgi:hypothetical protein
MTWLQLFMWAETADIAKMSTDKVKVHRPTSEPGGQADRYIQVMLLTAIIAFHKTRGPEIGHNVSIP